MIVGTTVKTISTGRLYWVCRGRDVVVALALPVEDHRPEHRAPGDQARRPARRSPTTSRACAWPSACGVTPSGQPNRSDLLDRASGGQRQQQNSEAASFAAVVIRRARHRGGLVPRCARPTSRRLPGPSRHLRRARSQAVSYQPGRCFYACRESLSELGRFSPAGCGAARRALSGSAYSRAVCGLLGLLTSGADAERGRTASPARCAVPATAAPTRAAPGTTPTSSSASTGCRSSMSSTRTSRCTGLLLRLRRALHDRLQRGDLQLPRAAGGAGARARRDVRHGG